MAMNRASNFFKDVATYFVPVLKTSKFHEDGVLTPEEFVKAGDQLIASCPTWQWSGGEKQLQQPYLPPDKQFLVTRKVPSFRRATGLEWTGSDEKVVEADAGGLGADGWLSTHSSRAKTDEPVADMDNETKEMDKSAALALDIKTDYMNGSTGNSNDQEAKLLPPPGQSTASATVASADINGSDDDDASDDGSIPDMDDLEDENLLDEEDDPATVEPPKSAVVKAEEPDDDIVKARTYDLSITYDKFYRTPRVYLFGYDENQQPLTAAQIMEDISCEHANKTVTVENHPHLSISHASIHPCKHAHVMKRLVEHLESAHQQQQLEEAKASGKATEDLAVQHFNVEQYMFLFLKFMASVIPTIEYDATLNVG